MSFLPDLVTLLAFSGAAFLLAVTPGPDMTLFLGRTLAQGRRAGLTVLAGTMCGAVVHTALAVTGVSAVLAASPSAFTALKVGGALYLLWLAWQAVRGGSTFELDTVATAGVGTNVGAAVPDARATLKGLFLKGLGVNLLNPKVLLFYISFLPAFVDADDPDAWQKMLFLGLYFTVFATPICAAMIFAADRFAAALRNNPRIARGLDWLFATVFAVFAVRILTAEAK